jgi:hypothetical protein
MKKVLLSASLAINIVFLLFACTKENVTELQENSSSARNSSQVMLRNATANRSATACTGPYGGMPYSLVREMITNYRSKQQRAIETSLGFKDANTCWFELDKIKEFICHLETLVEENNCANIGPLGLRFYYGAHGNNPAAYGMPGNYARLHNLVIIPTYENTEGINMDFDPAKIDPATCTPMRLNKIGDGETMNNLLFANSPAGNIFAMNHGQLGPPDSLGTGF